MTTGRPRDWDAASYDRVSGPQLAWARELLERLPLRGDETVLDAGCGSGRVTRLILDRLDAAAAEHGIEPGGGRVVAVDAAPSMVELARATLDERATVLRADLAELALPAPVDAVFSNAVFHWVRDHDGLFRRMLAALRPGGRIVAQCGGAGNVAAFHAACDGVAADEPFASALARWTDPWLFATPEQTRARLEAAGFETVETWLEPAPVEPAQPREFVRTVCLGHHLAALPERLREPFVDAVLERCGSPLRLDYVRLNVDARRPGGG